jgi:hypothetical protein
MGSSRHKTRLCPHAPPSYGSALETEAARRRPVDYSSREVARWCAYGSRQHSRVKLSLARGFLVRNYSSQEASCEAAWKWAAWKSLGPPELAASPVSGAELDAAVDRPARRAAETPRYVAPGAGAASRNGGGESVAARILRVSQRRQTTRRPAGVGTGCGGRRRWDSGPRGTRARMAQLSRLATRSCREGLAVGEPWVHVPVPPLGNCGLGQPHRSLR